MNAIELRERMEEMKVLKLALIRKGDFINATMLRDRIHFYQKQLTRFSTI